MTLSPPTDFSQETSAASVSIQTARSKWPLWRDCPLVDRLKVLGSLRLQIVEKLDTIITVVSEQTRKPATETLLNEIIPTLSLIHYYEKNAEDILKTRKRPGSFLFPRSRFHVEYHPRGIVVVLAPYNFPFQLAVVPIISALVGGNAVICKVSEKTPKMAPLLKNLFESAGFPNGVVQFESGGSELGEELVRGKPDLIFLTGSVTTGKHVMKLAAENLTPTILELGGKDPMIIFSDAPFERAVNAAVYGAFANAGQVCVSVERLYVQRPLFETFVQALVEKSKTLNGGENRFSDFGPLMSETQVKRFKELVQNAVDQGARLHTPLVINNQLVSPVILTDLTSEMRMMHEEIFGPALSVIPFDTEDEAIKFANQSEFGLNASVWTTDLQKGRRVASQIETGNIAVNDVLKNIGNPHLPFGGIKWSGIGYYHGPEGLRAFCRPLSVMVNSGRWKTEPNWFPYDSKKERDTRSLIGLLYAGRNWLERFRYVRKVRRTKS